MKKTKKGIYLHYSLTSVAPSDARLTLAEIAKLWVKWNIKEISGDDFALGIRKLLKTEITTAWDEYCRPASNDPLEKLLV